MCLIAKAAFEGSVHIPRYLVEQWNCVLPWDEKDWRRIRLPLEWAKCAEKNALIAEWSALRERVLLLEKHAPTVEEPEQKFAL